MGARQLALGILFWIKALLAFSLGCTALITMIVHVSDMHRRAVIRQRSPVANTRFVRGSESWAIKQEFDGTENAAWQADAMSSERVVEARVALRRRRAAPVAAPVESTTRTFSTSPHVQRRRLRRIESLLNARSS
jgi:hypothetical protein